MTRTSPALLLLLLIGCQPSLELAACHSNDQCTRAICVQGRCTAVDCVAPGDCPSGTCELRRCVAIECQMDADCSGGLTCVVGQCVAPEGGYVPPPRSDSGQDVAVADVSVPDRGVMDMSVPNDMALDAALTLGASYLLDTTLVETDCDNLNDPASGLVLEIIEGEPLRGVLLNVARGVEVALQGEAQGLLFTLNSVAPTPMDLLCGFTIEFAIEGVRQPGGGIAGDLHWTMSEPEPCEAMDLDCTRTDSFFGDRQP